MPENTTASPTAEEYGQSAEQTHALALTKAPLVDYEPKSKAPFRLNTLVPRNIAFEVQKALNRVVKLRGNLDHYVMTHLKYPTLETMWKGLAAEQVDSLALYLFQFESSEGIIFGDKTGIGKGRQCAAVIRHALVNGYIPVFITRKDDLFTDIYRDLVDIGHQDIRPFILNTGNGAFVKDKEGHVVFSPLPAEEQRALLTVDKTVRTDSEEAIAWYKSIGQPLPDPEQQPTITLTTTRDNLPADYNAVFASYSQIQAAAPYKRNWLAKLVKHGVEGSKRHPRVVFILDESHMAGGYDSVIGKWMRKVLPDTKACAFASATYAKDANPMPFYARKTVLKEAKLNDEQMVNKVQRGGLPLQEIIASNLAESGQLMRRERSTKGVKVHYRVLNKEPQNSLNRARVDRLTKIVNAIIDFEASYVQPVLEEKHWYALRQGEHLESSPKQLGVKRSPYFSRVSSIMDQLRFSLKVDDVAELAIELLKQDKKVVIAFSSTMGAFLKDLNVVSGDVLSADELDFANVLKRGLDSTFYFNYTDINNNKSRQKLALEELPAGAIERYNELVTRIQEEKSGFTVSPIDRLIKILQETDKPANLGGAPHSKFRVAEVTGRNQRIAFDDNGNGTIHSFKTEPERYFREFNAGEYDVLLINASGSTGFSAHASKDFADQRMRSMLIQQIEKNVKVELQRRGRTERTGQVALPDYWYFVLNLPGEKRAMMNLKAKLKGLDANTTGSQKTNDQILESEDFLNKYGDAVAWRWVDDNRKLSREMLRPTYHRRHTSTGSYWERNQSAQGAMLQVTGRAALLSVKKQEKVYNDLSRRYKAEIRFRKQRGTYDLETEFLPLNANIHGRYLFASGTGGVSPFGKDTVRDVCIVDNLKRPFTRTELDEQITAALDNNRPEQLQAKLVAQIKEHHPTVIEKTGKEYERALAKLNQRMERLEQTQPSDEEAKKKHAMQLKRLQKAIADKQEERNEHVAALEADQVNMIRLVEQWQVGDVVQFGSTFPVPCVYLGAQFPTIKDPYSAENLLFTFAVADGRKVIDFNATEEQSSYLDAIIGSSSSLTAEDKQLILQEWNMTIKAASQNREKRHILTENLLAVADLSGTANKLIKYNTSTGQIKSGILLARKYGEKGEDAKAMLPISKALAPIKGLQINDLLSDLKERVTFKRTSETRYEIIISKKGNYGLFGDQQLRELIIRESKDNEDELPDFIQKGGKMRAQLHIAKLEAFLNRLSELDLKFMGYARQLEDWEIENEEDWKKRTESSGEFKYRLSKPYGQGSSPSISLLRYEEPTNEYPNGLVVYDRPLRDSERFNYGLVPVFSSVEVPFQSWKSFIRGSEHQEELRKLLKQLPELPLHEAIFSFGQFMKTYPHEQGNHEFVFGDYTTEELGRAAYEDFVKPITELDELIQRLNLELTTT